MKAKVVTQVFVLISLLFLFATPAVAAPVFFQWGGEKIVKEMDLPDTPTFQIPDGTYLDVGYRYKQISVFFIPIWNYDEKWCGYIGNDKQYLDLSRNELSILAEAASLKLPDEPSLPLWDSIGGKLLFLLILVLYFGYQWLGSTKMSKANQLLSDERYKTALNIALEDANKPDVTSETVLNRATSFLADNGIPRDEAKPNLQLLLAAVVAASKE